MKRILITGAAGFLGSHLCDRFIHEGYHVIGMDNFITGSEDNISHLFPLPNFEFYHHDVSKFVHVAGELDSLKLQPEQFRQQVGQGRLSYPGQILDQ